MDVVFTDTMSKKPKIPDYALINSLLVPRSAAFARARAREKKIEKNCL